MGIHSCVLAPHLKAALGSDMDGKYGRMFPGLPAQGAEEAALLKLGKAGSTMDADLNSEESKYNNPHIPAGWPIFGQFIAHDITADRSLLQHHANFAELHNFREPRLDLEALYAAGPGGDPFLYDLNDGDKLLIGLNDLGQPADLPRNQQGRALIGDPRNDVHGIISQMHVAFLKFHNKLVDHLRDEGVSAASVFSEAQRLVRWYYQWIIVHEFLPLSVGQELVNDILENGAKFFSCTARPYIPVEFSDAAYRFGHSQISLSYKLNDQMSGCVFPDFAGTRPVPHQRVIDWRYFFALDPQRPPQPSKRIDTKLAHALIDLPLSVVGETEVPEYHSLACRDLQRARSLDLPSGEAVAMVMEVEPLSQDELGLAEFNWQGETPLWYYVLKEAEVRGNGRQLGDVGGRIVAEVLLGLISADQDTYLRARPQWQPALPARQPGNFTMADLLTFAGVA